jgi:uncharacterized membrane protein
MTMAIDSGPPIGAGRNWTGKIFLVLALSWFGLVFYIQRPDLHHLAEKPTPVIKLADGKTYKVYLPSQVLGSEADWVQPIDTDKLWAKGELKTQYTTWDFMRRPLIRFLITAMGPIFLAIAGAFLWLAIAEWRVRRRYPSTYDSLF